MADNRQIELLNEAIETLLSGAQVRGRVQADHSSLLSIAADLPYCPRPAFRAQLRTQLRRNIMSTTAPQTSQERQSTIPYLIVRNAPAFLDFLSNVFGAKELIRVPMENGLLMHAAVQIEDSYIELADASDEFPPRPTALHVYVPNVDEVVAKAVAAGAE